MKPQEINSKMGQYERCFEKVSVSSVAFQGGQRFFRCGGQQTQEVTFTHAPTADDGGWLVTAGRQAEAVRDALSLRPRGGRPGSIEQELRDAPRRGVRESKAEVKGKKPTCVNVQGGAWMRE